MKNTLLGLALGLAISLWASVGVASAGAFDSLDQLCGGVLSNPGCVSTVSAYPIEMGAIIGVIELEKSSIGSAEQCKTKLGLGASLYNEIAPYVSDVGADVGQMVKCACTIAYATQTCSGAVTQAADEAAAAVTAALDALEGVLGLDNTPTGPTRDQIIADYWAQVYQPLETPMITVSDDDFAQARSQLYGKCYSEWWSTNEDPVAICRGFGDRFNADVSAQRNTYQALLKGQQQAAADKLQKEQDAATDQARKYALNWAKIKLNTYVKQCHDQTCVNGVTFVAFAYYGQMATGMAKLSNSNTQVLIQVNTQFDPLFADEIKKDQARLLSRVTIARSQSLSLMAPRLARQSKVMSIRDNLKQKLTLLGVRNTDLVLRRAAHLRALHVKIRGASRAMTMRPKIHQ